MWLLLGFEERWKLNLQVHRRFAFRGMASGGVAAADKLKCDAMLVDKLPEEINEMKIKDEKVEKVGF